jgi:hypothetical protein
MSKPSKFPKVVVPLLMLPRFLGHFIMGRSPVGRRPLWVVQRSIQMSSVVMR